MLFVTEEAIANSAIKKGTFTPLIVPVFIYPTLESGKRKPQLDNIFIDVGCSNKEEVEIRVHVGCVITYPDEFYSTRSKLSAVRWTIEWVVL